MNGYDVNNLMQKCSKQGKVAHNNMAPTNVNIPIPIYKK